MHFLLNQFILLSNFYLNLSKYLNKNFHSFDTLIAENFYNIKDFSSAKKIYERLKIMEQHLVGMQINKSLKF